MYPSKRSRWSSESMAAAFNEVKSGFLSLQKARRKYNVPIKKKVQCADIYIANHVTGRIKEGTLNGKTPVPTVEKEKQLL